MEKTKMIFRKWMDGRDYGDVIALFPEMMDDPRRPDRISSYMHVGQHGGADYQHVVSKTRLAKENEYANLLSELKQIGYTNLAVCKRR